MKNSISLASMVILQISGWSLKYFSTDTHPDKWYLPNSIFTFKILTWILTATEGFGSLALQVANLNDQKRNMQKVFGFEKEGIFGRKLSRQQFTFGYIIICILCYILINKVGKIPQPNVSPPIPRYELILEELKIVHVGIEPAPWRILGA